MDDVLAKLVTELNDRLVVVEGKRDIAALERIGVRSCIMTLDKLERSETLPDLEAAVLTDYDRSGEIKARKAEALLEARGVKVDSAMRIRFKRIFGALTIEDVPHIFSQLLSH